MQNKGKKVLLATFGSRGDIQPMVGFAIALRNAGHHITFQGPKNSEEFVKEHGFEYLSLSGDPEALMNSEACKELLKTGDFMKFKEVKEWQESYGSMAKDISNAVQNKEVLVAAAGICDQAYVVHKKTNIPLIIVALQPFFPTKKFGPVVFDEDPFRKDEELNIKMWESVTMGGLSFHEPVISKWTQEWELAKPTHKFGFLGEMRSEMKIPVIGGFSEEVISGRPDDWPDYVQISGYFDLESSAKSLDTEIEDFLQRDLLDKPLFLSFGSMSMGDPKVLCRLASIIIEKLGKRVILSAGWTKLEDLDITNKENVLIIKAAPYNLLFPRCSVIIHHGGAGTTGAALTSGTPQVVVAFFVDQPFWANAMQNIGVASKALNYNTLKEEEFLDAVKAAQHEDIRKRAAEVGAKVRSENGQGKAVSLFESFCEKMGGKATG